MNQPQTYNFQSNNIRVAYRDGEPWFVAKDVAEALDYQVKGGMSKYVAHVPEQWRGVNRISTPSGEQEMTVLSEAGMFFFLNRSDKPKASPATRSQRSVENRAAAFVCTCIMPRSKAAN